MLRRSTISLYVSSSGSTELVSCAQKICVKQLSYNQLQQMTVNDCVETHWDSCPGKTEIIWGFCVLVFLFSRMALSFAAHIAP